MSGLKDKINKCLDRQLHKPYFAVQAYYKAKCIEPDYRFGYSCKDMAEAIVDDMGSSGHESFALSSVDGIHTLAVVEDKGRYYLADPSIGQRDCIDISEITGNPGKTAAIECYPQSRGTKNRVTGTEKGFTITEFYYGWWDSRIKEVKYSFDFGSRRNLVYDPDCDIKRVIPLMSLLDFDMDDPQFLQVVFTSNFHFIMDYDGNVTSESNGTLKKRVLELIGNGVTMEELMDYTKRCMELYRENPIPGNSALQKRYKP